jgi:hypothetical protein
MCLYVHINQFGFSAVSADGTGANAQLVLSDAVASGNTTAGVSVGANVSIGMAHSTVTGNGIGASLSGTGAISTLGDNNFTNNAGGDVVGGSLTTASPM